MIRAATEADTPRLVEMALRFIMETPYRVFPTTPAALSWIVRVVLEHGAAFVAEDDGHLVGMIGVVVTPHPLTGERFCDEVVWWVEPEHRSLRTGPALLHRIESWAVTNDVHLIRMIAPNRSGVGDFYERCGYVPVETSYIKRL